jgi:Protein of unknown function (DUF2934)
VIHHRQAELLKLELETCLRSANLAVEMYNAGDRVSADRTRTVAEECYSDVFRLLSDPKESKHLTIKAIQEFKAKMGALRKTLDELQRVPWRRTRSIDMEKEWKTTTGREGGITTTALTDVSEPENQQEIAALAYEFWQARGCPEGTPEEDWYRAEQEIAKSKVKTHKAAS